MKCASLKPRSPGASSDALVEGGKQTFDAAAVAVRDHVPEPSFAAPASVAAPLRRMQQWFRIAAAAVFLTALPATEATSQQPPAAQQPAYSDEEVKAAFLYNFGTYVQWPSVEQSEDAITLAILSAPAIAEELERFVRGRTIQGRSVRVRRLRTVNDLGNDEVLFIGADENWRLAQLIAAIDGRPTLIVTDAPDGLSEGAMVNFQLIERRVRFEISLRPAQDAGLMLSSRLLSAALRVETTRCRAEECRHGNAEESARHARSQREPGSRTPARKRLLRQTPERSAARAAGVS